MVAFSSAAKSPRAVTVRSAASRGLNHASMAGRNCHSSMSAAMQAVMKSQRRMKVSGAGRGYGLGRP